MEKNIKEKEQLLEKTIKQIEKEFGKGAIMLLSDSSIGDIEVISSASILLDDILGVKGFPKVVLLKFMDQNRQVKLH